MKPRLKNRILAGSTAMAIAASFAAGLLCWSLKLSLGPALVAACLISIAAIIAFNAYCSCIMRPLDDLMAALEELGKGNFQYRNNISGDDELGRIGKAINTLSQDLHNAQEQSLRSYQQNKFAEIGWLASGVGHELKSPLNAALNAVFYMRDALKDHPVAKEDPTLREMIELAEKELRSITNVISDLLSFSRVIKLNAAPSDIHGLIDEAKSRLEIPERIRIEEKREPALPKVLVDAGKMTQVFLNLARNAIQAMPEGGTLTLTTQLDRNPQGGSFVVVAFKDTGVGIAPDKLGQMYEPVFTRKGTGAGMGLVLSNRVVAAHGGSIDVESQLGKGSTFTVKIPLAKGKPLAPERA